MPSNEIEDRLLSYDEAAAYLGFAAGTLRNKVSAGGVPHLKLGKAVRFRRSELDAWVREQNAAAKAEHSSGALDDGSRDAPAVAPVPSPHLKEI